MYRRLKRVIKYCQNCKTGIVGDLVYYKYEEQDYCLDYHTDSDYYCIRDIYTSIYVRRS